MLMPTLGYPRLTSEQGAEILKRDPLRGQRNQHRSNSDRCGSPPPPTPKRNCSPFAQRYTATSCHRCRRLATMRQYFLLAD